MADRRIRIPKGHGDLVQDLLQSGSRKGPFRLRVDVLAFAAAVGANQGRWEKVEEADGEPIRLEVFERQDYVGLINLLAVLHADSVQVLASGDDNEEQRAQIFEGYAKGGLQVLADELRGMPDYLEHILLLLTRHEGRQERPPGHVDLRAFGVSFQS